jgi:hypothetical protein
MPEGAATFTNPFNTFEKTAAREIRGPLFINRRI